MLDANGVMNKKVKAVYLTQNNMGSINKKSMVTLTGEPNKAAGDSEYMILVVCPV